MSYLCLNMPKRLRSNFLFTYAFNLTLRYMSEWPSELSCDRFPAGGLCVGDQSTPSTLVPRTPSNPYPSVPPRPTPNYNGKCEDITVPMCQG